MMYPKLDGRSTNDILAQIKKKSEFYTPEWRYDPEDMDAGGALARIFAEMFYETIDRYNRFPDKCYLEFLNMQGVCAKPGSPSVGLAVADLVEGAERGVVIPRGTQLFTDVNDPEEGDRRLVFETASTFAATPAKLREIYMTDPVQDMITCTDVTEKDAFPLELYAPDVAKNIERHRFSISHDAVLLLNGNSEIRVVISRTGMTFRSEEDAARLADPTFAKWYFTDGESIHELTAVKEKKYLVLKKDDRFPIAPCDEEGEASEDEGRYRIFCDMKAGALREDILVDSIKLNSRSVDDKESSGITPDHIYAVDTELDTIKCGYPFGREPNVYDSFYIACDEAFSKRGAAVTMELDVRTVIVREGEEDVEELDFNKRLLVDKADVQGRPWDDISITDVVWEYWNGLGWARLEVSGVLNPFSCKGNSERMRVEFICPEDFAPSMQNAHECYWLRARIRSLENRYSLHARWLLPLVRRVGIRFDYGDRFLGAECIVTENNVVTTTYTPGNAKVEMRLFGLMKEQLHALYFKFDRMPNGYPINLSFDFAGNTGRERVVVFEYLTGDRSGRLNWRELKVLDGTRAFENSGIVSLFTPGDFLETELFGTAGYWIRAVNRTMKYNFGGERMPRLAGIRENAVNIIQKQSVKGEPHEVAAGKPNQALYLQNRPVMDCEVWIDELPETPLSKLRELADKNKNRVRVMTDPTGEITEFWIKWEQRISFADCDGEDRVYELDATRGVVSFGDGVRGRIPAYRNQLRVAVDYAFGGGSAGNLPAEAIDGLIVSIPYVERMTNATASCGGSDEQSIQVVRKIGTKRIKHHGRAVTAEDYESLVLEEFNEIAEVKCFTGRGREGEASPGHVTVVILPKDLGNDTYTYTLCKRVEDFLLARTGCEMAIGKRLNVVAAVPMRISAEISVQLDDYEYAARAESDIIAAVSDLLERGKADRIGTVPSISTVMTAIKTVEHVSYINRILLVGEYYHNNELVTVSVDDDMDYKYFVAVSGEHIVRL